MKQQDITDIAVKITSKLVELGYIRNCIDTDFTDEFDVQDEIELILNNEILCGK